MMGAWSSVKVALGRAGGLVYLPVGRALNGFQVPIHEDLKPQPHIKPSSQ